MVSGLAASAKNEWNHCLSCQQCEWMEEFVLCHVILIFVTRQKCYLHEKSNVVVVVDFDFVGFSPSLWIVKKSQESGCCFENIWQRQKKGKLKWTFWFKLNEWINQKTQNIFSNHNQNLMLFCYQTFLSEQSNTWNLFCLLPKSLSILKQLLIVLHIQQRFQRCLRFMFTRKLYPAWKKQGFIQLSFTEDCLQKMSLNVCHQFLIWSVFQQCGLRSCLRMNENRWRCTSTAVGGTGVGQLINFGEIEVVFVHFARTSKTQSSKSSCYISLYSGCWNIKLGN